LPLGEGRFERHDAAVENDLVFELHLKRLAEVERAAVEVEEVGRVVDVAPVAEARLAAVEAARVLDDGHAVEAGAERGLLRPADVEGRARVCDPGG
jgi:hypothetical protein